MECPICKFGNGFSVDSAVIKGSCDNCGPLEITEIAAVSNLTADNRKLLARYLKSHPRKAPLYLSDASTKLLLHEADEWDAAQALTNV